MSQYEGVCHCCGQHEQIYRDEQKEFISVVCSECESQIQLEKRQESGCARCGGTGKIDGIVCPICGGGVYGQDRKDY